MDLASILNGVDEHTSRFEDSSSADASFAENPSSLELSLPVLEAVTVTIDPPPEATYDSEELAIAALHSWTKAHGFNVTKRRAFYTSNTTKVVWKRGYDCDRAGKPKNTMHLTDETRKRPMRGSSRMGCPMKIITRAVSKDNPGGPWEIVHSRTGSRIHNHEPSVDARVHPGHRQRGASATAVESTTSLQDLVQAQTNVGISSAFVCASLTQADPDSFVIPQDIANMKHGLRQRELSTQTVMEALFARLEAEGFYYKWESDPETHQLRYLFWSHPKTLNQFRRHPQIVGMDCTYKTNKYKLPLLNIISLTGFNTVLPVAQCWLPREREEDYYWAMTKFQAFLEEKDIDKPDLFLTDRELALINAISEVFPGIPSLICRWHMTKNVLSKVRQVLGQVPIQDPAPGQPKFENTVETDTFMDAFYDAIDAKTEEEFNLKRVVLQNLSRPLTDYLDNHWFKYKTRIVRAWTDRYRHFGIRDTSFVEGAHAKCKIWLRGCGGDIYKVFLSLLPWWQAAASSTSLLAERNAVQTPYLLQGNRYGAVARVISVWALKQTHQLWEEARAIVFRRLPRDPCTGVFRKVHGRPCLHELIDLTELNSRRLLTPHDFDVHWWIKPQQAQAMPVRVQEPMYTEQAQLQRRRRKIKRSRYSNSSARRDPVLFERVDRNHPATPPRSVAAVPSALETTLTVLPPPLTSEAKRSTDSSIFHVHSLPPRYWGYASWN